MTTVLLSPPITFIILIILGVALSAGVKTLAAHGIAGERKLESYACGQRNVEHSVSPDYGQFFPYAFFFTIMHVLVLVVATAPVGYVQLPLLYVAAGALAWLIIFRR
ncbi:MAG: hypothetical protein Q4B96_00435 [Bacillota bacterium]|nr:hypothetical protein [Bacillota bacterium]